MSYKHELKQTPKCKKNAFKIEQYQEKGKFRESLFCCGFLFVCLLGFSPWRVQAKTIQGILKLSL